MQVSADLSVNSLLDIFPVSTEVFFELHSQDNQGKVEPAPEAGVPASAGMVR